MKIISKMPAAVSFEDLYQEFLHDNEHDELRFIKDEDFIHDSKDDDDNNDEDKPDKNEVKEVTTTKSYTLINTHLLYLMLAVSSLGSGAIATYILCNRKKHHNDDGDINHQLLSLLVSLVSNLQDRKSYHEERAPGHSKEEWLEHVDKHGNVHDEYLKRKGLDEDGDMDVYTLPKMSINETYFVKRDLFGNVIDVRLQSQHVR